MSYKKFMMPLWLEFEQKIIKYFETNDISTFWNCPEIVKAMILPGQYMGTLYCQAHHLFNYWNITKKYIGDVKSFIEYGGGYGVMSKVIKDFNNNPYTIIDLPIINKIQQYCLKDEKNVNFLGIDKMEETDLDCEMFISLYALNECSATCIEYVMSKNFFNAKNILMCFRKKDNADFKTEKFIPEFKKFGDVVEMDDEGYYLIK